ncbi:MAG: hypothetical protein ACN4GW_19375, partial [Desulforhopalus sp.]
MKSIKNIFLISSLLLLSLVLTSCMTDSPAKQQDAQLDSEQTQTLAEQEAAPAKPLAPASLPVRYQTASYLVDDSAQDNIALVEESALKVGARITSTRGPQPLWDIVKRLASLKGMNVSWSSDVDQNVLVDVDIGANDDFYQALDSMLRQVDYFHEMDGNTIVVKYRETRQFQISMPFNKQTFSHGTGGNVLGDDAISSNVEGTIEIKSRDNEFDIWKNIRTNMDTILEVWAIRQDMKADMSAPIDAENIEAGAAPPPAAPTSAGTKARGFYIIDEPVGLITVTAPRPLLEKMEEYFSSLKKTLYKQISIEAKIIEVQLRDASSIGINWTSVLKDFNLNGLVEFGTGGALG